MECLKGVRILNSMPQASDLKKEQICSMAMGKLLNYTTLIPCLAYCSHDSHQWMQYKENKFVSTIYLSSLTFKLNQC